jgi:hypothetical protein
MISGLKMKWAVMVWMHYIQVRASRFEQGQTDPDIIGGSIS